MRVNSMARADGIDVCREVDNDSPFVIMVLAILLLPVSIWIILSRW